MIDAEVNAIVKLNSESSSDKSVVIQPHDDGIGADITKNDGIYSAYFTHFLGKGRHGVEVLINISILIRILISKVINTLQLHFPFFSSFEFLNQLKLNF